MVVDFTKLSQPVSSAFDTDYMDIYRQIDDDPERDLLYSNVKCHIAIKTADNPDPTSVDVQPKIVSLRIHTATDIDLKNNDYVIAKRCDLQGNVLHYYSGIIGEPAVSMARQSVNMIMSTLDDGDEPLPPPPPIGDSVTVTINYLDGEGKTVHEPIEKQYKKGTDIVINPLIIDGYTVSKAELDGQEVGTVEIDNIQEEHTVTFYYTAITQITNIRVLVDGDYIKDNGQFATGLHLYAPISILSVESANSLKLASNKFYHEEMGNITLITGDKFRDNLNNWHILTANPLKVDDGYIITFEDTEPVDCYVTHWYD